MSIIAPQIGIDVSKKALCVSINRGKAFTVSNSKEHLAGLVQRLPEGSVINLEATGGYERLCARTLQSEGFEVRTHNALKTKRLAQAHGVKAKTDAMDAQHLSAHAGSLKPCARKSVAREDLSDFVRAITSIKATLSEYRKRIALPELDEDAALLFGSMIEMTSKVLKEAQKDLVSRIGKNEEFKKNFLLAKSVPCIGEVTAAIVITELPEDFKARATNQISSYTGIAPMDDESGNKRAPKHIRQGNKRLKAALYMPAITAISRAPWAKELYARLKAKGRTHQSAIVAVMRRLLVRVIAVLKRGTKWIEPQTSKAIAR